MAEWLQNLLFLIVGGVVASAPVYVSLFSEGKREARKARAEQLAHVRQQVIKTHVDEGIAAVQRDLVRGLERVEDAEHLLMRASVVSQDQDESLRAVLALEFNVKADAKLMGLTRIAIFGSEFQHWPVRAYNAIDLYLLVAQDAAARLRERRASQGSLTDADWEIAEHLLAQGKLFVFTLDTGLTVIRDLDFLNMWILEADYSSHLDPLLMGSEDETLISMRQTLAKRIAEYDEREDTGLHEEAGNEKGVSEE